MMNILLRELKANFVSLMIWTFSMGAIVFVALIEYEAYADNPQMVQLLEMFPPEMAAAFGLTSANLTTLPGFVAMFSFYYFLVLSMYGGLLGVNILSKEERDKTGEYLFTLPISRRKVVVFKMLAGMMNIVFISSVTMILTYLSSLRYNPEPEFVRYLLLLGGGIFFVQMIFFTFGILIASLISDYKKAGKIILGVIIGTWSLSSVISMVDSLDFMKYASPFKYFEASVLVDTMKYEGIYLVLSFVLIVLSAIGSLYFYQKRDLYI